MQGKWMITSSSVIRGKNRIYLHFVPKADIKDKSLDNMKLAICGIRPQTGWIESKYDIQYCKNCQFLLNKTLF